MITDDMVFPIGRIKKPHGYKGNLGVEIFFEKELFADPSTPFFVKMDNILVPFFVDNIGGGRDGMSFLKFKDIDSDADAAVFSKKDLYALKSFLAETLGVGEDELNENEDELTGYIVVENESSKIIGIVEGILEGLEYDYLIVKKDDSDESIEIPIVDEFINEISESSDPSGGEIRVSLPEGFLNI